MNALLRDAHNGKLVSIRKLFDLALAYEHKLAEASKQIPVKQSVPIAGAHASEAEHQSKRRRPEGNACERGDSDRATARNQTDTNRPTNDATAAPDSELVPTTARGRGRGRQSESGKEKSCARSRQRLHKHAFTILMTVVTLLGGQTAFTMFVVGMIRAAKELDKRRKPPIARFRTARLEGVTIAAIDKLRFSSIWDENDDELDEEAEAEMRDARPDGGTDRRRETTATDLDRQGKALLRAQYPEHDEEKVEDQWVGGLEDEGMFSGCNVVHVMAVSEGKLLGFIKALVTMSEVFVDEILVSTYARGQALASHLLRQLLNLFPRLQQIRLLLGLLLAWSLMGDAPSLLRNRKSFSVPHHNSPTLNR